MVDDRVAAREHGVHVEPTAEQGLLDARQVASDLEHFDRAEQPLTGHARPVRALAADERLLDNHRFQPGILAGVLGGVLTGGRAADDNDIPLGTIRI